MPVQVQRQPEADDTAANDRDLHFSSLCDYAVIVVVRPQEDKDEPQGVERRCSVSFDPDVVRAFEHAGWQQAAGGYEATFARATGAFVEVLLDAASVAGGARMLDLCCGTGVVTKAASDRGATPVGLDFSPAMLTRAQATNPALRFAEGDAEAIPYPGSSFDAAVSNFGIHHIPRPERALAEACRVPKPGGQFAFTTWAVPSQNLAWRLLFDAIAVHGDPSAANTPPPGGNLGSPAAALRLLRRAGFQNSDAKMVERQWHLPDAAALIAALRRGTVRTAALIAAQPALALPAITAAVGRDILRYRRGDGFAVPIMAILAFGTKSPG